MALARKTLLRSRRLKLRLFRIVVFLLAAIFFIVPIYAMLEFSTRGLNNTRTLTYWQSIFQYPDLIDWNFSPAPDAAINASLELALITSLVMLALHQLTDTGNDLLQALRNVITHATQS